MRDVVFDKGGTVVVGVGGRFRQNLAGEASAADRHGHDLCCLRK